MKIFVSVVMFLLVAVPVKAQVQISAGVGMVGSINMGEIGPAPVLKGELIIGDRFQLENDVEFSPMDKYTKAGWFVSDGVDVLVFPSQSSGFFMSGGFDYRHRNGGAWAKDGIRVGGGIGYEKENSQIKFSVKDKVISLNDNIKYFPYFELFARSDYPIKSSKWNLKLESKLGFFKYIQNDTKRSALYSDVVLGLVYRWGSN